jgi:hypothetical protein
MRSSGANQIQKIARRRCVKSTSRRAWTWAVVAAWIAWVGVGWCADCWSQDAADASNLGVGRQREVAVRQLERARATVEVARAAAARSKGELDQFLAAHFEFIRSRAGETLPEPRQPLPSTRPPKQVNQEAEQLNSQINELKLRRDDLLQRFTQAHPEVVDVENRLGELMLQLSSLEPDGADAESVTPGDVVDPSRPADAGSNRQSILLKQQQMAAEEYEQHVERWQASEEDLKTALDAEEWAAARLAAIQLPPASRPAIKTPDVINADPPVTGTAPAAQPPAVAMDDPSRQQGSQPLALAALLIALAVAALAAVRLARSSSDVYFENVDDLAAALALPVVGVITSTDNSVTASLSQSPATRWIRNATFACELLLAVIAFALVAYGVQNPGAMWHACTHPLESLSNIGRYLGN